MKDNYKTSLSDILIRIGMYLLMPFIWLYYLLSPFIKDVFSNVYGRLVKYLGLLIFVALIAFIYSLFK